MSTINSDEIISILKEEIQNYDEISKDKEVGQVVSVGDGIATIYGIDHAAYGEIVTFENGLKGWYRISARTASAVFFSEMTVRSVKERSIPYREKCRCSGRRRLYRTCCQRAGRADRRQRGH